SHVWEGSAGSANAGDRGELYRYSYSSGSYTKDFGPLEVTGGTAEALTIAKDSMGKLWITWVQDGKVYVNHSTINDSTWVSPYVLPVTGADVDSDDLSAVVAYDGRIGIMWSNQSSGKKMYFAAHLDTDDDQTWQNLLAYSASGDDHINLKALSADSAGKIFALFKTGSSSALIVLLVCDNGACTSVTDWSPHTVYGNPPAQSSPTRPALLLDTSNRDIYVFARVKDAAQKEGIYYKRSDMDSISFSAGDRGDLFIKDSSYNINDPTTTKQNVTNTSGIVVMASDSSAKAYFHNCIRLAAGNSTQCIAANPAPPTPQVLLSSDTYLTSEDGAPTVQVEVQLTSSTATDANVTVDYAVTNGTAENGLDYTASSGTLTFINGNAGSKFINIPILEDIVTEPNETVNINLSNLIGTGVEMGTPDSAILTITDDDVPPQINFSSASFAVMENDPLGKATIEVMLSHSSDSNVTVQYQTANGTATAGQDYQATTNTLTFLPGEISKTFDVILINDNNPEPQPETVLLSLSNPSANASLGTQSSSTLTINDDDAPLDFTFEFPTYSVVESEGPAHITVVLSRVFTTPLSVFYQTAPGGTATNGSDYTAIPATQLTFAPGQTLKSFPLTIIDNDTAEPSEETVMLQLSSPTVPATLGVPSTATLTIFDDDIPPPVSFGSATYSVNEDGTKATIDVTLTHTIDTPVTVTYETANGTATAGSDYTAIAPKTLTINTGQKSATFDVLINDDDTPEPSETVELTLSNPSSNAVLGTQNTATLTIVDNDSTLMFESESYEVAEDDQKAIVTVKLEPASEHTVKVDYETLQGSALADVDFQTATGQLIFNPGVTSQQIEVAIFQDGEEEGEEDFSITLSNPENGKLGTPKTANIKIVDQPPTAAFVQSAYTVNENQGQVMVTVQLSRLVGREIRVDYSTNGGTATADDDYQSASGTLVFPPWQPSKSFTVDINNDSQNELDETIYISLGDTEAPAASNSDSAIITIVDDDRPEVQFKVSSYAHYGDGMALVDVVLSEPAEAAVTVNYATSNGTAVAGVDYVANSGSLVFGTNTVVRTIAIEILRGGSDKTINLTLSNPQLADLGTQETAVLTIKEKQFNFLPFIRSN
ncbi:MAG: Calx-beta domain-containing protein, partial [Candidatus Promineifilaceae bacterium]|nr:Calx-beta domain-containing protein [Candidatus Promineifilaceae bacterium]